MCGIAGVVRWDGGPPPTEAVRAMCDRLVHRGPDDEGYFVDQAAALGMRRLSIIDLETGHQPVSNEDGTVWVVFNGEIYNFKELRKDLESQGHRFRTTSDTETIVHLYEDYGRAAIEHLRGMFALALWDARRRQLILARDRLGIKPLYYAPFDGGLAFASEVKALLELPELGRDLNWSSVVHLLAFATTPPDESILRGIHKLEPGRRAVVRADGRVTVDRYWDVAFAPDTRSSEGDLIARLRALIDEAVGLHLRSDVPVGVFLSGGVDSSAVLASMVRLTPGPIRTFSIGFQDVDYDELPHARRIAAAFGTDHHDLVLEPQHVDFVEDLIWHLDEPFGDSSAIPTYVVSRLAATHVKVVLSGDGGDEIFGGYDKYVVEQRERRRDRLPAALRHALGAVGRALPEGTTGRNFLRHLGLEGARRYLDATTLFGRPERARLLRPEVLAQVASTDPADEALRRLAPRGGGWLTPLQYADLQSYLPLDILTKVDRMTMAHSLEARPALLDHRVVEFAATVPPDLLLRGRTTKYLLKQALRGALPDDILDRPKHGFAVPLQWWFRGQWGTFVRELLLSTRSRQRGIFEPDYLELLLRLHEGGRNMDGALWLLASLELWCRAFLDGGGSGRSRAAHRKVAVEPTFAR
jgi:asparagine synthase (glutamine-hydrolysing)